MKKIKGFNLHNNLPLPIQQMHFNEKSIDYDKKLRDLEFSIKLYQTKRTTRKNFHRPISKIV